MTVEPRVAIALSQQIYRKLHYVGKDHTPPLAKLIRGVLCVVVDGFHKALSLRATTTSIVGERQFVLAPEGHTPHDPKRSHFGGNLWQRRCLQNALATNVGITTK